MGKRVYLVCLVFLVSLVPLAYLVQRYIIKAHQRISISVGSDLVYLVYLVSLVNLVPFLLTDALVF